jgi:hypothetical protein
MKTSQIALLSIMASPTRASVSVSSDGAGDPVHARITGALELDHADLQEMVDRGWIEIDREGFVTALTEGGVALVKAAAPPAPIPMVLHCPRCAAQHVDAPEPERGWTNPPHKSHLCHSCGCVWRPADVATVGVKSINTRGSADTW